MRRRTTQECGQEIPHHVPEFVESHNKAGAHPSESFEGPDVNFDPYLLLNASEQLAQRTASAHWTHSRQTGHTTQAPVGCCMRKTNKCVIWFNFKGWAWQVLQ